MSPYKFLSSINDSQYQRNTSDHFKRCHIEMNSFHGSLTHQGVVSVTLTFCKLQGFPNLDMPPNILELGFEFTCGVG